MPSIDVERIVVLERADAADSDRAARTGRAARVDRDARDGIEPLKHARPGLPLRALDVDAGDRAGDVAAPLLRVRGDHHLLEVRDLRHRDVDPRPAADLSRAGFWPMSVKVSSPFDGARIVYRPVAFVSTRVSVPEMRTATPAVAGRPEPETVPVTAIACASALPANSNTSSRLVPTARSARSGVLLVDCLLGTVSSMAISLVSRIRDCPLGRDMDCKRCYSISW